MNVRRAAVVGWFSCMGLGLFTSISSVVALWGMGVIHAYAHPYWQWWLYLPVAFDPLHPTVTRWVWRGALAGFVLPGLGAYRLATLPNVPRLRKSWLRRSVPETIRGVTDNHGHADWLPVAEQRRRFPGTEGIVVGAVCPPGADPASAATSPLLIDPCEEGPTHSLVFAGPGGGKSTSAVTTLLHWPWSAVVLDPARELGPMLTRDRQTRFGQRVFQLDIEHPDRCAPNALDWIDTASPQAPSHVMSVIQWIGGERAPDKTTSEDDFWRGQGQDMMGCILAHLLWSDLPPEAKTLRTFRKWVATPKTKMRERLRGIHETSASAWARDVAGTLWDQPEDTFGGIYSNATRASSWLANPAYAALVSGDSFRTSDITDGNATVFLQIPPSVLDHTPGLARVIVGALLNAAYVAEGQIEGRVLFLLDEAFRLGPMRLIEEARDLGRKYAISLQMIYQSVGQLEEQWGRQGKSKWYEAVSWRSYSAIGDLDTAKELSAILGDYSVLATSEGSNTGTSSKGMELGSRSRGANQSVHEIKRALMRPDEIMGDMRTDERLVIPRGARPFRCATAAWFRRPELRRLVDENRFHKENAA